MDSIWNDPRIWIAASGFIISTLGGFIIKRLSKDHDILFEKSRKTEEEMENLHIVVSGHLKYHEGLKNRGSQW